MRFGVREWILVAFGIVFIYFATQSFRSQNWGVFVIDLGVVSIVAWYLFDQRRSKTGDEKKAGSNGVETAKRQTKGQ